MWEVVIKKDWEWFLAEISWYENIFAYWATEQEAQKELLWVVEMMMDFHLEQIENERKIKNNILNIKKQNYALQV